MPGVINAQPVQLSCIDPKDNFTISIVFDSLKQQVVVNDMKPTVASITQSLIEFSLMLDGVKYFHRINRSTGSMMIVNNSNGDLLSPYQCSLAKRKF